MENGPKIHLKPSVLASSEIPSRILGGELALAKYRHRDYACAGAPFDKCRFGRGKILNRAITMPPNGVSRSYTATPRRSPSDAGLFGGIRDLAHRRAFEAYDKAAIRSHPPPSTTVAGRLAGRVGDAVQGGHTLQNDRRQNSNLENTLRLLRRLDSYPDRPVLQSFRP
jgi:hypothetical protein